MPSSFTHEPERGRRGRPSFSSTKTADRLRECERRPSISSQKIKPQRLSIFKEEGLDDLTTSIHPSHHATNPTPLPIIGTRDGPQKISGVSNMALKEDVGASNNEEESTWYSKLVKNPRPQIKAASAGPPGSFSTLPRAVSIVLLIAVVIPGFRYSNGEDKVNISGADAGVIKTEELVDNGSMIEGRANSPTDICTRWAHQTANMNGTLYIYGGEATTQSGQTTNTWNNNLLTLDLTKAWTIASPAISGLPQPSGPPAVSLGALWNSYESLFVYGGEFADNPATSPLPVSTWEYSISSSNWIEHTNPQTSAGNNSDGGNQPVQRSAEGAGLSVPELGRSWYFGGHLDMYTTPGWSDQIARVYLKSFLEFTHPGYANSGVSSLGTTTAAPDGGVYRNITQGGIQDGAGFTERADGVIVYVPGWGAEGIILGLAGGTNETFTEMNIIDIYDVANSTWYKQSTSGPSPPIRVNPCAVVAAAPDGSSFNIYLYGGQNLIPYGSQTQYSDMWILTIPSFTWIQVEMSGQSQPPARAGHTCTMSSGQMVVVGGYIGKDISCDSPGIYVFNASSLQWISSFTALSSTSSGSGSSNSANTLGSSVLQGSVGYQVPALVQSVIGGSSLGGATATTPAAGSATLGPIATGKPPSFTVTQSGSTVIQTTQPTSTSSNQSSKENSGPNVGAISAGVIAALSAILAGYLAFCTWLYKKQLNLYKDHVAMAQRRSFSPERADWATGGRTSEKATAPGVMLGPFGTEIGGSGSAGRPSVGESAASGPGFTAASSGITPGSSGPASTAHEYGGRPSGNGSSRISEDQDGMGYLGAAGAAALGLYGKSDANTAHSSQEDLLAGQEPSFFSVVLNPRRTLRVVNID
ncbi:hypothetical protein G7Y89_g14528 [Cudoniella acicularis]|uniref:Kelch repeat-containing protein n=1 Tax=Cudoniella acicularis TaxID=354080 RepID=A0A8H4R1B2_9HELO|nr:hypothetical protein G7Y89_g14528 [Cudoniella acicularis]